MPYGLTQHNFPNLTATNSTETSSAVNRYNCIAWAAGDNLKNWWPTGRGYWPQGVPRVESIDAFMKAYETLGYKLCYDERLEASVEKIAIFGTTNLDGSITPTHAARQLESGEWTSKMGWNVDISHETLQTVSGPFYGQKICCMSRPRLSM